MKDFEGAHDIQRGGHPGKPAAPAHGNGFAGGLILHLAHDHISKGHIAGGEDLHQIAEGSPLAADHLHGPYELFGGIAAGQAGNAVFHIVHQIAIEGVCGLVDLGEERIRMIPFQGEFAAIPAANPVNIALTAMAQIAGDGKAFAVFGLNLFADAERIFFFDLVFSHVNYPSVYQILCNTCCYRDI